ncbi:hypothetical protein FRC11_004847 [Ceratobasidium sp. 423]|nr:hypothetical protein FRC11_004847 [Ceratobasidium sp. 423]
MNSPSELTLKSYNYSDDPHDDNEKQRLAHKAYPPQRATRLSSRETFTAAWSAGWPLALQFVLALGTAAFVVFYIDGTHFNIHERRPVIPLVDGRHVPSSDYTPLQTDITSTVSVFLGLLRLVTGMWAGSVCWRGAFLLMTGDGLRHKDLERIAGYELLSPSTALRGGRRLLLGTVLLINIVAPLLAPVLTGSITWTPSSTSPQHSPDATIGIPVASIGQSWQSFKSSDAWRGRITARAASLATTAWGRANETHTLKRVLPTTSQGLNINSTVANITIPYFSVTNITWLSNPQKELTGHQKNVDSFRNDLGVTPGLSSTHLLIPGTFAFIPDDNTTWGTDAPSPDALPTSFAVSETRIIVIQTSNWGLFQDSFDLEATRWISIVFDWFSGLMGLNQTQNLDSQQQECGLKNANISGLPESIGFLPVLNRCYAFAQVTYQAGVGACNECRLSSPNTVQNDTTIQMQNDTMTQMAWWMIPDVTNLLLALDTNIPSPKANLDNYISELLLRSYSGAWNALHENLAGNNTFPTSYAVTVPAVVARVDMRRVYAWLGVQILATLLGVWLLTILIESRHPLVLSTNVDMVPFYLNTTGIITEHPFLKAQNPKEILYIQSKEDDWRVTIGGR